MLRMRHHGKMLIASAGSSAFRDHGFRNGERILALGVCWYGVRERHSFLAPHRRAARSTLPVTYVSPERDARAGARAQASDKKNARKMGRDALPPEPVASTSAA